MQVDPRYELIQTADSPETGSTAYLYQHRKSGAQIFWLKNDDDHKCFGIGFRTPPNDSSGVAHIVEHSVLSGSRKFKSREPFMELYKSSLQTFLNAMTFSDMTLYPIASKNDQDFLNLSDVYLDAVFFPSIYEKPEIFMQEGWHHEIFAPEEAIRYKGVVYNEMRGAFGNPESQIGLQISQTMHPDGTYSHESGGYPYAIPELTYADFLAFHKRYYHPSNSFIFLYGDIPQVELFERIDRDYLNLFEATDPKSQVDPGTRPKQVQRAEFEYNAEEGATDDKASYFGYNVILGESANAYDAFMQPLVNDVLIASESSPLKQRLLEENMGEAIIPLSSDGYFSEFGFLVKAADAERFDEFITLTENELARMVREGVDQAALGAALNRTEMALRESGGAMKAIYFFIRAMGAKRYDRSPLEALNFNATLEQIRKDMADGGFERYIQERILDNPSKVMTLHRPKVGQFQALDEAQAEQLAEFKASLSEAELHELIAENEALLAFQQTEETPEEKATIPKLRLEDIQRETTAVEQQVEQWGNIKALLQPYPSMGIRYMQLAFDLDFVSNEDLPYLAYLCRLLGIVDTQARSFIELNNAIYQVSSGFGFTPSVIRRSEEDGYRFKLMVSSSALANQSEAMLELLQEVMQRSELSDENRIRDVLQDLRSRLEMGFERNGSALAATRARSYFSPTAKLNDTLSGIGLYDHLNELLNDYAGRQVELIDRLQALYAKLFSAPGLIASITCDSADMAEFSGQVRAMLEQLPQQSYPAGERRFEALALNEGITSGSGVQYVAKAGNFKPLGIDYSGEMVVLKNILSRDYLHNLIRAQGGAYGSGLQISPSGEVSTTSYRDPNLRRTLEVFDGLGAHLEQLALEPAEVEAAIIGSVMEFDPVLSASSVGALMLGREISGLSKAKVDERLQAALAATPESMKKYAPMLERIMQQNNRCVFGNASQIEAEAELFDTVRRLKR